MYCVSDESAGKNRRRAPIVRQNFRGADLRVLVVCPLRNGTPADSHSVFANNLQFANHRGRRRSSEITRGKTSQQEEITVDRESRFHHGLRLGFRQLPE